MILRILSFLEMFFENLGFRRSSKLLAAAARLALATDAGFALGRTIADMYSLDYEKCQNPNYQGSLSEANGVVLARKFISKCKSRVE